MAKVSVKSQINYRQIPKWNNGKTTLLLMTIPSFLFVLVFSYGPLFGWVYAFFEYKLHLSIFASQFKGFSYLKIAFEDPNLLRALRNTLAIFLIGQVGLPLAMFFAIFLSEVKSRIFKKTVQTASTMPYFIGWIIVFSMTYALFAPSDGILNKLLLGLGWITVPMDPIGNNSIAWFFQVSLGLWKSTGYSAIVFFAAIAGIDQEQYEAAVIDGASRWQKIRHITIPNLMATYIVLLIMGIGFMLSSGFEQYYVFMNPMVQSKIEVMDYLVYRIGLVQNNISISTALSMTKTLISLILLFGANFLSKKVTGRSVI